MRSSRPAWAKVVVLGLGLAGATLLPSRALEKGGMPDLSQEEQTCLPTSAANLVIWFGHHGYPKLLRAGDTEAERDLHTLHALMTDTNARYDLGTRGETVTYGIRKYIHDAGYSCDVEYRGLDWGMSQPQVVRDKSGALYRVQAVKPPRAFTQDWLQENNDPDKGFILLLAYVRYNPSRDQYSDAFNAGHAVTLVNAGTDFVLIHDPAHRADDTGRKNLTPTLLTSGTFEISGAEAPVAGLMLLSGSALQKLPDSDVMLTGAVCITMHPEPQGGSVIASVAGGPHIGAGKDGAPGSSKPATPAPSADGSWATWLASYFFGK